MEKQYQVALSIGSRSQIVRVCDTESEADLVKDVVCRVLDIINSTRICVEWSFEQVSDE